MSLVSMQAMLGRAQQGHYAVGAFNFYNLESCQAILRAAEAERSPVIIQVWSGFDSFIGIDVLAAIGLTLGGRAAVPVAVHLDHGLSLAEVGRAVVAGLRSVMIDGSSLPFDENVRLTSAVRALTERSGIAVEGEIGHVGNSEYGESGSSDQVISTFEETVRFYEATGVDSLAVSIGSAHGQFKERPRLDIALLRRIAAAVDAPLVLHGGSYIPDELIVEAVRNGICKINVATELGDSFLAEMRERDPSDDAVLFANEFAGRGYAAMEHLVRTKMKLFQSSGKAD